MNNTPTDQSNKRSLHVKVKTAKGRKSSSTRWLQRQLNDPYVQKAKDQGYRSRAAFKLIELNEKFQFLKPNQRVVDLGAAPGGWLQVLAKACPNGTIIGIDLQEIEPVADTTCLHMDFMSDEALVALGDAFDHEKIDVVLSDMAAASSGHSQTDHLRIIGLCEVAYDFAKTHLCPGGVFIAKILQGGTEHDLLHDMKRHFDKVKHFKPGASRKDSAEMYVVALGFKENV